MAGAAIAFGAEGAVISISNIDPRTSVQLYDAAKNRNVDEVQRLQERVLKLSKLYTYGAGVSCMKTCMQILDVCCDYTTSPLLPLNDAAKGELRKLLIEHGLV